MGASNMMRILKHSFLCCILFFSMVLANQFDEEEDEALMKLLVDLEEMLEEYNNEMGLKPGQLIKRSPQQKERIISVRKKLNGKMRVMIEDMMKKLKQKKYPVYNMETLHRFSNA